jgi:hypothetical protein
MSVVQSLNIREKQIKENPLMVDIKEAGLVVTKLLKNVLSKIKL